MTNVCFIEPFYNRNINTVGLRFLHLHFTSKTQSIKAIFIIFLSEKLAQEVNSSEEDHLAFSLENKCTGRKYAIF